MGLGKTIQLIALMVANQPNSEHQVNNPRVQDAEEVVEEEEEEDDEVDTKRKGKTAKKVGYSKTTLIVAPASLLHQVCTNDLLY